MNREDNKIVYKSLFVNSGLNLTLSMFVFVFVGFEDPFSCKNIKWMIIMAKITNGIRKCREKNRLKVGWLIEGPPQIQDVTVSPKIGIADSIPVITVAPQNDIWPHGNTYPRKAVIINNNIIKIPDIHTFFWLEGELK